MTFVDRLFLAGCNLAILDTARWKAISALYLAQLVTLMIASWK